MKIFIPSDRFDTWTKLEKMLENKFSGHTDTEQEASILIADFCKRDEIHTEQHYQNALDNFESRHFFFYVELHSKKFSQITNNNRHKIEEDKLIVMDKSTQEANLAQALQANNKQIKFTITFLIGYNGFLKVTEKNKKFFSDKELSIKMVFFPNNCSIKSLWTRKLQRWNQKDFSWRRTFEWSR